MTTFAHKGHMNHVAPVFIAITLAALSAAEGAQAQAWRVESSTDAFSDKRTVTASVRGRGFAMVVRCKSDLLETYFLGGYVGDDDANVRYRIDGGEVQEDVWDSSTSKDGLFADAPGEVARWMASGSRMVLEYEDFSGTPHQFNIPLGGSAVAINQALDACGVPRTNPRTIDGQVWRRVVIDIDKMDRSLVRGLQNLLNDQGFSIEPTGRRTQGTYAALSTFYSGYWTRCGEGQDLSASCTSWRSSKRLDPDADYTKEPIDLLLEVIEAKRTAAAKADTPTEITDVQWSRQVSPEFPERAQSRGITQGAATVSCKFSGNGSLSDCRIVDETPAGAGFGQAVLRAARSGRLSPRTVDGTPTESRVTFTTDFKLD
ncbi:energy transducer TonB [Brevundimonas faecalis]|uniref:TonB family protein n=1 Tax=Brevundimonas faecalis TaxID=947378 RepID=A0ABV2RF34_9CAUL